MSLTRYLPTPSDRMGLLWTLLSINDSVILEYGTAGTSTFAMRILMGMGIDTTNRLFTTHMGEAEVIMGDSERLEQALETLDNKLTPKVIFVMASSVTAVTGADVKGICRYMQEKINAKIIVFTEGGFSGDFSQGIQTAYTALVSNLAVDDEESNEESYNILGMSPCFSSGINDLMEVKKMMKDEFGMSSNAVLCMDTTIAEISSMAKAKVNIVLSWEGLEAAKLLEKRFGTPYVYGIPMGYSGTLQWLSNIAKAIGKTLSEESKKQLSYVPEKTEMNKKLAVHASYDILNAVQGAFNEFGVNIEFLLCTHNIKKIPDINPLVTYKKKERDKIDLYEKLNNTIILDDSELSSHADKTNHIYGIKKTNDQYSLWGIRGIEKIKQILFSKE